MRSWWPFVLIVMGAARMVNGPDVSPRERGKRRSGVWLIVVGLWGLVNEWRVFGLSYGTSWPLLVMASGAMMVWRSLEVRAHATSRREPSDHDRDQLPLPTGVAAPPPRSSSSAS